MVSDISEGVVEELGGKVGELGGKASSPVDETLLEMLGCGLQ